MTDETFKLNIDGKDIEVPKSYTLMQACEEYRLPRAMVQGAIVAAE